MKTTIVAQQEVITDLILETKTLKRELENARALELIKVVRERDEAREQIKELICISERAIALAEIDFENDKFGVVSELRDGLAKIKEAAK